MTTTKSSSSFAEFKQSRDRNLAMRICDELDKHTKAEDTAVYPVFEEELSNEADKVHEAEHEHQEARRMIGRVRNTSDEAQLVELMAELEQAIHHHVQEEESEMLPRTREELPAGELTELGDQFESAKNGH
jgi:hemerythrin-like domain-containing protein